MIRQQGKLLLVWQQTDNLVKEVSNGIDGRAASCKYQL